MQLSATKWTRSVEMNQQEVSFIFTVSYYREIQDGPLQMTQWELTGAGQQLGVVCLIDDVLVCGKTQQEPDQNLTAALQHIYSRCRPQREV